METIAGKWALGIRLELQRASGVPDRVLAHRGRRVSITSFIGLEPTTFWGWPPSLKKRAGKFWEAFLAPGGDALNVAIAPNQTRHLDRAPN
jgi:hypothetical protein